MKHYVLAPDGGRFGRRWAYGDVRDPVVLGPAESCPVCGRPVSLMRWVPPHRLRLSNADPRKWGAFVWGAGFDLIVSAQLKALYEREGLAGVTCFYPPVEIVGAGTKHVEALGVPPPVYHVVDVAWNGANLHDKASGAIRDHVECPCPYDRGSVRFLERLVLDADSWTGADIFTARGLPGRILVSERFKSLIERDGLGGSLLIPAERYAYDETRPGMWYVRDD